MTQAIVNIQETISLRRKAIVIALAMLVVVSGLAYGYCIKGAINYATTAKSLERQSSEVAMSLAVLESEYLSTKNSITPEVAENRGFVTPKITQFISQKSLEKVVSVAHEI